MKRSLLVVVLCGLTIAPAFSQNTVLKIIACGEKELADEFNIVGRIVIPNFTTSNDALAYFGLRHKFSSGFAEFLVGHSFQQENNSLILGGRALYLFKRIYAWQLFDLYPKWRSIYTETMIEAIIYEGIEIGVESSTYSQFGTTSWCVGPNLQIKISDRMKFGPALLKESAGGNFIRLTAIFGF
jgi:hypothetical protein